MLGGCRPSAPHASPGLNCSPQGSAALLQGKGGRSTLCAELWAVCSPWAFPGQVLPSLALAMKGRHWDGERVGRAGSTLHPHFLVLSGEVGQRMLLLLMAQNPPALHWGSFNFFPSFKAIPPLARHILLPTVSVQEPVSLCL